MANLIEIDSQAVPHQYATGVAAGAAKEWVFGVNNGNTEQITIVDELLDTEPLAREAAMGEMLKNSYALRELDVQLARTDLWINDVFRFKGLDWVVKHVMITSAGGEIYSTIKAVRYE